MAQLILGLALFLGAHSTSIFAMPLRTRMVANSETAWKILYSLVSLIGIILIAKGYASARLTPTLLYSPPLGLRHVAALFLLPAFILFFAPYFPGRISRAAKHPQLVAVKLWAVCHLLVNGTLADVVLFGSFLTWAVVDRISMKRRTPRPVLGLQASNANDFLVVVLGVIVYVAFVMGLHQVLFGIAPF